MKKILHLLCCIILLSSAISSFAQPNYTANDKVKKYTGDFLYGIGGDYYPGWTDDQLADIAAGAPLKNVPGVGVGSIRVALFEHFLEYWGYNIRANTFNYYQSLGLKDQACIIGYPIDGTEKNIFHREKKSYCDKRSELFENMYLDIWDGGLNGTPINEKNYYAAYLYKMVNAHKGKIKFWEVWNEPDLSSKGYLSKNQVGNWWTNNPLPCDMPNIYAPVFNYNRLLRISWEVIKTLEPDSYVCIGGIGYPSFLDAVMRNTDNPNNGKVTAEYPLKGGAYFDVLDFHSYPHVEGGMKYWDNGIGGFKFIRHSDQAVAAINKKKLEFTEVMKTYGYGTTFPNKEWIITESNIPRKMTGEDYGGEVAQRNYVIKGAIECQKIGISQWYIYQTADRLNVSEVKDMNGEFAIMGLYNNLKNVKPYNQIINNTGIAHKTMSDALKGKGIDLVRTNLLGLNGDVNGAAFVKDGKYTYVLWAKTKTDKSEVANATFTFPIALNVTALEKRNWDYSNTKTSTNIGGMSIALTGDPIFLIDNSPLSTEDGDNNSSARINYFPNPANENCTIQYTLTSNETVSIGLYDNKGILLEKILDKVYAPIGKHELILNTKNLPSGMYHCRMESNTFSITKKLNIIK